MFEFLSKLLDFIAKYSWASLFTCLIVLIIPTEHADKIGLTNLRDSISGYLIIILILSIVFWTGHLSKIFKNKFQLRQNFIGTLKSLSSLELMVIRWCLLHNNKTIQATSISATLQSLASKGIVNVGGNNILNTSYHIRNDVWRYLIKKKNLYLPSEIKNDQKEINKLNKFASNQLSVVDS